MSTPPIHNQKARRLVNLSDNGPEGILMELESLDSSIESAQAKADAAVSIASEARKMEGPAGVDGKIGERGEKGENGDKGDSGESITGPQGPQGVHGEAGKPGRDGTDGIDGKSITGPQGPKGEDGKDADVKDLIEGMEKIEGRVKLIDQRWHGAGLSKVSHDTTLAGSGTPSDPLSVLSSGGVTQIVAGTNVTLSPAGGTGIVTVNATGGGGSGTVTSVATDSSLTGGPVTTTGTLGLNLAHSNAFTAKQTISLASLAATTADGFVMQNPTAATSGAQAQVSPAMRFTGHNWNTGAGTADTTDFRIFNNAFSSNHPAGDLMTQFSGDGGSTWANVHKYTYNGVVRSTLYANQVIEFDNASSAPGDNYAHLILSQPSTNTPAMIAGRFNGTYKGYLSFTSGGTVKLDATGGGTIDFNQDAVGMIARIYSAGFYNNYNNINNGRVTAGNSVISPPSILTVYGSTGRKTTLYTNSATLGDSDGDILVDASAAFACSGTPSTQCPGYSDQTNCEANSNHGFSCLWSGAQACSTYDGTNISTCTTGHPGCTWDTASCSAFNNNSGACVAQAGCSYPGNAGACSDFNGNPAACVAQSPCAYPGNLGNCTDYNGNEATCLATTGCTPQYTNCSAYSDGGGDGTACAAANPLCSYDTMTGICSGSPYASSCLGNYDTGACTGTYDTGVCNGTYDLNTCSGTYGTCSGTVICGHFNSDPTGCTAESGCSGATQADITLPVNPTLRQIPIMDVGASGTCKLWPGSGQTLYLNRANPSLSSYDFSDKSIGVTYYSSVYYITDLK